MSVGSSVFDRNAIGAQFMNNIDSSNQINPHWSSNVRTFTPRPLVICGPSGSGKSTLLKRLMNEFGDYLGFSISHTTRKPREGEINGREYHFIERHEMEKSINEGDFIEFTQFSGNYYGTSRRSVFDVQRNGKICVLDVEIDGVRNLKRTHLNARYVFIKPPTVEILEKRLRGRGTESEESILKRLNRASIELEYGNTPGEFDLVLVNDDINDAYIKLKNFLIDDIERVRDTQRG